MTSSIMIDLFSFYKSHLSILINIQKKFSLFTFYSPRFHQLRTRKVYLSMHMQIIITKEDEEEEEEEEKRVGLMFSFRNKIKNS